MAVLKLLSSDKEIIEIDAEIITRCSFTIQSMLRNPAVQDNEQPIPVPLVRGDILRRITHWAIHHENDRIAAHHCGSGSVERYEDEEIATGIASSDLEFFRVDPTTLVDLIMAANYLDIREFMEMGCKVLAYRITGKKPEEIRQVFNIVCDLTPEEQEQIRRENEWIEERK